MKDPTEDDSRLQGVHGYMKGLLAKLQYMGRNLSSFSVIILICAACIAVSLVFYFDTYSRPYLMGEIVNLSEGWQYKTDRTDTRSLGTLRTGPWLQGGEKITLYKTLDVTVKDAAILIRANHQVVNVYLGDTPLYIDREVAANQNPGMALHFVMLPENYTGKTLTVELTSPYDLYAGRTSSILLGTMSSLEAYTLSASMRSVILMSMCLLIGFLIIVLTLVRALAGSIQPQGLAIGVFAVIWALYYVCTEYITFQFFSPYWMSTLSLGLYFLFQVPLTLYFYFSFKHYKKWMLPAVCLHGGFAVSAILLHFFGIVDLPQLVNINNVLLIGLIYTVVLAVLEALKRNPMMMLATPFLAIAYVSMLHNFVIFYSRSGSVSYTYRDTYFLLMLCVLIYEAWLFFKDMLDKVNYDALTGIYNRRYLTASLQQIMSLLLRSGGKLSVLMVDVDYFKKYNDAYGHGSGDECLKKIANALRESIKRADNFVARYGGEEFILVLPNTDEKGARLVADRIHDYVKACDIPHNKSDVDSRVTVSIGATTADVNYRQTFEEYIRRADEALYISKQAGRNRYTFLELMEQD